MNPLEGRQPFSDDQLEYMREMGPPKPPWITEGLGEPPSDRTSDRIAQLGRLRGLLWHVLRAKVR